jgi:plastocyanin
MRNRLGIHLAAAALMAAAIACGGSDGGGGSMSPTPPSGSPGPSGATITIANGAVSPSTVTIAAGQSVTFVNSDSRAHDIASDPHPVHSNCPEMNALGNIPPGTTRSTNAFPVARSCGFHDHNDPDNRSLQGTVVIQ